MKVSSIVGWNWFNILIDNEDCLLEHVTEMIKKLDKSECLEVLTTNYLGRLAYISGKSPFVVPITYFHDVEDDCILSYSSEGFKLNAMREQNNVSLQVDDIQSIQKWRSVLVHGRFEELKGSTAKQYLRKFAEGVQDTIVNGTGARPRFIQDFSSRLQKDTIPVVYRIHIAEMTGRQRNDS